MRLPLLALLAFAACGATPGPSPPGGLSADARERIDALFAAWDRPDSPGCALGVVRDGALVYARGYGSANLEFGIPIDARTVFDIGSTSKQFTAACIALLEQDGKLSVADDVRTWVPELPDYGTPITLLELLNHTSGLRDYLTLFFLAGIVEEDFTDATTALAMLADQEELDFEPGTEHAYSNSGYFLLSQVVERASGMPLPAFARRRLFGPLGMDDTRFRDDHTTLVPRRATGHATREDGSFAIEMSDFEQAGDGAVLTTVEDLARWDANFYEPRVGGPALAEFLRTPGRLADGTELEYCRGLMRATHGGLPCEGHGGSWAGYGAELLRVPSRRTSVICLANLSDVDPETLAREVGALVLGEPLAALTEDEGTDAEASGAPARAADAADAHAASAREKAPAPLVVPPAELAALAGDYRSDELGVVYRIDWDERALTVEIPAWGTLELVPVARDEFEADELLLRVERDARLRVTGFRLDAERAQDLRFERDRD